MMELKLVDIVNLLMLFQLSTFTYFLIDKGRSILSNRILAGFFIAQILGVTGSLIASINASFYAGIPILPIITGPIRFLWAPLMYLYVKSLVYTDFSLRHIHLLHLIPSFSVMLLIFLTLFAGKNAAGPSFAEKISQLSQQSGITLGHLLHIHVLTYNMFALITLEKFKRKIKNKIASIESVKFSWLKFILYGYIVASLTNIILPIPALGIDPMIGNLVVFAAFLVFFTMLFYKALINPDLFTGTDENPKYSSSPLAEKDALSVLKKLDQYMEENRPYLDPSITVKQLADNLSISDRILSQIINEYLKKNFYDFINNHRINYAKNLLHQSVDTKLTVLEILYEAGFNSKSAFNVAFKKKKRE